MKNPQFTAWYGSLLVHVALLSGEWRNPARAQRGMFSGPQQQFPLQQAGGQSMAGQFTAPQYAQTPGTGGTGGGTPVLPGLTSNSGSLPARYQSTGIPMGGGGNLGSQFLQSQRFTSATALAPNVAGMWLSDVAPEGGATAGGVAMAYWSPNIAIFVCPASGLDATGAIGPERAIHYPVSWALGGTNVPSTQMVFKGGLAAVTVTYSTVAPTGNPDISAYRAIYVTGTESGTGGTARTVTFDAAPGIIRGVLVMINVASGTATGIPAGNITYAGSSGFTQQIPAQGVAQELQVVGVQPMAGTSTQSTTHTATTLGGATTVTIAAVHFY